jgi:hypothetical protein
MHRVSAQKHLRATVQDGVSRIHPQLLFLLQRYRSARQSPVQNGVLGLDKQLQLFRFLCTNMAALSFFQQDFSLEIKHMNRPLHLYMLEMFTPYLFKSNRRKTSQEHPSAKERSSVLKTLKTAGTI